ncbi:MAG: hypothetical protein M0P41_06600 [Sphaerochaeta sp.]|nr:hypothetical protein [Sphaerochaeta sp.]
MGIREIGSLFITGQFKDMGLMAAMRKARNELVAMGKDSQGVTNDMMRMTNRTKLLTGALGLIGIGGFASMVSMMPRVNAQLSLAKTYVQLIALELDDNFAPVVETANGLLETFVGWFQELPEPLQTIIGLIAILAGSSIVALIAGLASGILKVSALKAGVGLLATALSTLWGWIVAGVTYIATAVAGSTALTVAVLAIVAAILLLVADALGFFDWIDSLIIRFQEARDEGSLWAAAITALLSPIGLLGDAIDLLLGRKSWDEFKGDIGDMIDDFVALKDAILDFASALLGVDIPSWVSNATSWLTGNIGHDVGTANVTYTGWHWLEAGESVSMRGTNNSTSGGSSGGQTNITNKFGDVVISNGMDLDEFVEYISKSIASKTAWSRK